MTARGATPRPVAQIADDVKGSADMLEAAAYGISLQAQGLFSGGEEREHCLLATYYERIEAEAHRLRSLALELGHGGRA